MSLIGTKWKFNETLPEILNNKGTFYITFKSKDATYNEITFTGGGPTVAIFYGESSGAGYQYLDTWQDQAYRTIEIIGGDDIENATLIEILQANAVQEILEPPTFSETKTALKIYEDLTQAEYDSLEKEPNSFYLVNGVGVYKGETLIASATSGGSGGSSSGAIENVSELPTPTETSPTLVRYNGVIFALVEEEE